MRALARSSAATLVAVTIAACGGHGQSTGLARHGEARARQPAEVVELEGHPPLAVVARDGDPAAALAVAISTRAIAPASRGAAAVALSELMRRRLRALGARVEVDTAFASLRIRALASSATTLAARSWRRCASTGGRGQGPSSPAGVSGRWPRALP